MRKAEGTFSIFVLLVHMKRLLPSPLYIGFDDLCKI